MRSAPTVVSVIMPIRNGERWLHDQLEALSAQTYDAPWEVVAVDDGSTDGSRRMLEDWQHKLPLRITETADRSGINVARNTGRRFACGELLAFCDGDDVVAPDWLEELVSAAMGYDIVGGRLDETDLNDDRGLPVQRPRFPPGSLPLALGFLPFAVGANLAVWRDAFEAIGGFDERYVCGNDDVELSFRAQLRGFSVGYAPGAVVSYRHRTTARELFNQFRKYGQAEPLLFKTYRAHGMPPSTVLHALKRWARLALRLHWLRGSPERRGAWLADAGFSVGRLQGTVQHRAVYL
jgi:GT2 family glycosyltransferase